MIFKIIVISVLLAVGFIAKALMDAIRTKFEQSWIRNWDPLFWDPKISWMKKYEYKSKLFTGMLVFVTDGWHLLQFIFLNALFISLSLGIGRNWIEWAIIFIGIRILYAITFNPTYNFKPKK